MALCNICRYGFFLRSGISSAIVGLLLLGCVHTPSRLAFQFQHFDLVWVMPWLCHKIPLLMSN